MLVLWILYWLAVVIVYTINLALLVKKHGFKTTLATGLAVTIIQAPLLWATVQYILFTYGVK